MTWKRVEEQQNEWGDLVAAVETNGTDWVVLVGNGSSNPDAEDSGSEADALDTFTQLVQAHIEEV